MALYDVAAAGADGDRPAPARRPDDRGEELDLLRRVLVRVLRVRLEVFDRHDGVMGAEHGDAVGVCLRLRCGDVLGQLRPVLRLWFILCHCAFLLS